MGDLPRIGSLEPAIAALIPAEKRQGLEIYLFLGENATVPKYYQKGLSSRASFLLCSSKDGTPKYFILPWPYDYERQLACLHEYGHYLDDRPEKDAHLCYLLTKQKAINDSLAVRRAFTNAELIAWTNALNTIKEKGWEFPQPVYVDLLGCNGLRTYFKNFVEYGGWDEKLQEKFERVFDLVEELSPGFRQVPAIQNYYAPLGV